MKSLWLWVAGAFATRGSAVETARTQDLCHCEVAQTCLTWAIDSGQEAGVWGGLSEDERRALKSGNARVRRAGGAPRSPDCGCLKGSVVGGPPDQSGRALSIYGSGH